MMPRSFFLSLVLAMAAGLAAPARAACPADAAIDAFVADWTARQPSTALGPMGSMEDALCAQGKIVARLTASLGPVVGHKAGLTSKATQERFGVSEPVRGVLLRDMLLDDGATVPAGFGARPLFEADLILVIGSDAVNGATTPAEAIAHISEVRPFIELPDLALAREVPLDGKLITAINVGARLGVLGAPVGVFPGLLEALAGMTVKVLDGTGTEIASTPGSAVLGNPVESVLWLVRSGVTLKAGDLVSVGSIGPLKPPQPGMRVTVRYLGLPGDPEVSVAFE